MIKKLAKYSKAINLKKTNDYQVYLKNIKLLKKHNVNIKINNEFDLQLALIYINCINTQIYIHENYLTQLNETRDFFNAMTYKQKQIILNGQIINDLDQINHFYQNDNLIILPCYEMEINNKFVHDYQSCMQINIRHTLQKDYKFINPLDEYGVAALLHGFSSFNLIKHFDDRYYIFLKEYRAIYVFDNIEKIFDAKYNICDKYYDGIFEQEKLEMIVDLIEAQEPVKLIDYLCQISYINSKSYRKITK